MNSPRPFRFGVVINHAADRASWLDKARRVEDVGFDTFVMGDHLGERFAPLPALALVASVTRHLRIGTTVFCNDWRNPVLLAREVATLDVLSDGRLEVGIGGGWRRSEYEALGVSWDSPGTRIGRLDEAVRILKGVWTQRPFSFEGEHYRIGPTDELAPRQIPHPPLLVGAGAPRSIAVAAQIADIVNLTVRTMADGSGIDPEDASYPAFQRKCALLTEACADRAVPPERSVMLLGAAVDQNAEDAARKIGWSIGDHLGQLLGSPAFVHGSVSSVADDLLRFRAELGLTYYVILEHAIDRFAPVIAALRGR